MTGDLSELGQKTADDVTRTVLIEVVRKITIEHGDILVVRSVDDSVLSQFAVILREQLPEGTKFMLVNQDAIDIIREMTDEEMAELGWQRINPIIDELIEFENSF
jgi:hypothetical protein